jgi:acetyl esterase
VTNTPASPLDPVLQAVIEDMRSKAVPSLFSIPVAQARERIRMATEGARQRSTPPEVDGVEDLLVSEGGLAVPVRVYRPGRTGVPTLLFFHGGGFALGSIDSTDTLCRHLCRQVGAVVVSADYRLAPEHPFPAAHEDALMLGRWTLAHAQQLGGDVQRVIIAGESAGANLATSAAMQLRDSSPGFAAQLLIVPGVDFARNLEVLRSLGQDHPLLTLNDLQTISELYLGRAPEQARLFPPSPLHAGSWQSLPATVIAVAGHDHLRQEGLRYAQVLADDGVTVNVLDLADMPHPFLAFLGLSPGVNQALERVCDALLSSLKSKPLS